MTLSAAGLLDPGLTWPIPWTCMDLFLASKDELLSNSSIYRFHGRWANRAGNTGSGCDELVRYKTQKKKLRTANKGF